MSKISFLDLLNMTAQIYWPSDKKQQKLFVFWNVAGIFPFKPPRLSILISIYLASMNCHSLVPKQAGKLACHNYWGLKCSTKARFRHISGTSLVQGNRNNAKFSMLAGTPREELWLDAAGVSHTVNKRKKQGHSISQAK